MNADGSDVRTVTAVFVQGGLDWSPDGSKIAFDNYRDIYEVNVDGTGLHNITNSQDPDTGPGWQPIR